MKKSLKDRMEEATLRELLPGFDKAAEWSRLSEQLHPAKKRFELTWPKAAAVLLLAGAASLFAIMATSDSNISTQQKPAVVANIEGLQPVSEDIAVQPQNATDSEIIDIAAVTETTTDEAVKDVTTGKVRFADRNIVQQANETHRSKEFVCNGTPCPLEICIIQTISCKDKKPSAIATCNTLEPDQARQLHYKAPNGAGSQCNVTVDEIRIRRVATGETIVLNAHSKPSTAQELFNCITGREKCDLLAGIFENDCNNQQKTHNLKIDNLHGNLTVQ